MLAETQDGPRRAGHPPAAGVCPCVCVKLPGRHATHPADRRSVGACVCVKRAGRHASHLCRGNTGETMKRGMCKGEGSVYPLQGAAQAIRGAISQNGGPEAHVWMIR